VSLRGAPQDVRRATAADAARLTELFALAFYDDPTWSWAFPDPEQRMAQHRLVWGLFLHSALPYGWVGTIGNGGAASASGSSTPASSLRPATVRRSDACGAIRAKYAEGPSLIGLA
jgi:hypothetical protein